MAATDLGGGRGIQWTSSFLLAPRVWLAKIGGVVRQSRAKASRSRLAAEHQMVAMMNNSTKEAIVKQRREMEEYNNSCDAAAETSA
ncbi:unnamed protein product [Linum trigynum]|uniref:Uncharacterized protein n=1 Tax=Linum trigynum TaxID=586398 RepID=A0AAV2GNG8_9ROSI